MLRNKYPVCWIDFDRRYTVLILIIHFIFLLNLDLSNDFLFISLGLLVKQTHIMKHNTIQINRIQAQKMARL